MREAKEIPAEFLELLEGYRVLRRAGGIHSWSRPWGLPQAAAARGIAVRLGWKFCVYKQAGLLPGSNIYACLTQKQKEMQTFIDAFYKHLQKLI